MVAILALNTVGIGGGKNGASSKRKENSSVPSTRISLVIMTLKHCLRVALLKVRITSRRSGSSGL